WNVSDERISDALLATLCEDGFVGDDSHRADAEAVREVAGVVESREHDLRARAYATSTLGTFDRELSGPVLRRLLERRLLVLGQPKAIRLAAQEILSRWTREDARRGSSSTSGKSGTAGRETARTPAAEPRPATSPAAAVGPRPLPADAAARAGAGVRVDAPPPAARIGEPGR